MRVLRVQGRGRVSAEPDIVTLAFDVGVLAREYAACIAKLNELVQGLRDGLAAAGVDRTEIRTADFAVREERKDKQGEWVFAGYHASHVLQIELPADKELLNRVLQQVAQGQGGAEIRLSFSVKDKAGLRRRVLEEAVQAARENAEVLASAAGVTLGNLQQIDYGWAEVRFYNQDSSLLAEDLCAERPMYADIEPEDVAAEDSVTLVYELAD